ncbi:MAG: hypothetical protein IJW77_16780 [Clostridia bacterium]|nr:hypothetical protein [Clostridia bacterium]
MLENTLYRLQNKLGLTVVYFGGSITEGAGASSYDNCWAAKTTAYLRRTYPECEVKHVSAAIGGTGTMLGVYRCDRDVCAHHPDLVFFEFCVNDMNGDFMTLANNTESIIRKIRAQNPFCDIVFVYTITWNTADTMAHGDIQSAKTAHSAVAYYYGLPQVDIGEVLYTHIARHLHEGETPAWMTYTTDAVHPNDTGYQIYTDTLIAHLEAWFAKAGTPTGLQPHIHPKLLFAPEVSHIGAHMDDACMTADYDDSWTRVDESLCGRYPRYLECTHPGGTLTFAFEGMRVDLYFMMARDSGDIIFSVDGGEEHTVSSWDSYCKSFNRANLGTLISGLPAGSHTLTLRVSDHKNDQSEGYAVRIGAFLVL